MNGPVTLSMPRVSPGEARIRARAQDLDALVGEAERIGPNKWRARLWRHAGERDTEGEELTGTSLKELRTVLEQRIASQGQWWQ